MGWTMFALNQPLARKPGNMSSIIPRCCGIAWPLTSLIGPVDATNDPSPNIAKSTVLHYVLVPSLSVILLATRSSNGRDCTCISKVGYMAKPSNSIAFSIVVSFLPRIVQKSNVLDMERQICRRGWNNTQCHG